MHREKGSCFNCDEKFSRRHQCSSKLLLLIADDNEVAQKDIAPDETFSVTKEQDDQSQA